MALHSLGTSSDKIAAGTTAQRPVLTAAYAGSIRYNTELKQFEQWDGTQWAPLSSSVAVGNLPPATPNAGDLWYYPGDGRLYVYYTDANSSQWVDASPEAAAGGGASVNVGTSAPANPAVGDLWFDSLDGRLYVYYQDTDSSQWVDASPNSAGGDAVEGANVHTGATPPSGTITDGDLWYDTNDGRLYIYFDDGTTAQWADASPPGPPALIDSEGIWEKNAATISPVDSGDGVDIGSGNITLNADGSAEYTGDIRIGGTLPSAPNAQLQSGGVLRCSAVGNISNSGLELDPGDGGTLNTPQVIIRGASGSNPNVAFSIQNGTVGQIQLDLGGNVRAANTSGLQPIVSERRFKQNIEDFDVSTCWENTKNIAWHIFEYKSNPGVTYTGHIVDEVQAVDPSLVISSTLEGEEALSYDNSTLNAMRFVALQQALTRIEALEATNASLEARLTALEGGN